MYVSVSCIILNLPQHRGGYPHNLSNQVVVALFVLQLQQNEIELVPPGGCVTREVGRSVMTLPVF